MRNLITIVEQADPIVTLISKVKEHVPLANLFGGNCGMFALALADKLSDMGTKSEVCITCRDVFDGGVERDVTVEDIIMAETDVYHVFLSVDGRFYDGHGQVDRDEMADWIYAQYRDPSPVLFMYPHDTQGLDALMQTETNWSIREAVFAQLLDL